MEPFLEDVPVKCLIAQLLHFKQDFLNILHFKRNFLNILHIRVLPNGKLYIVTAI